MQGSATADSEIQQHGVPDICRVSEVAAIDGHWQAEGALEPGEIDDPELLPFGADHQGPK